MNHLTLFLPMAPARVGRVTFRLVAGRGVLVRLPHIFWLNKLFRAEFPRCRPARHAYTWFVPGKTAVYRLGLFERNFERLVVQHYRSAELARRDAEWDALAPPLLAIEDRMHV